MHKVLTSADLWAMMQALNPDVENACRHSPLSFSSRDKLPLLSKTAFQYQCKRLRHATS